MKYPITYFDKYDPAMRIAEAALAGADPFTTQAAADAYFQECVVHNVAHSTNNLGLAQEIERQNLAYWAGYYSHEIRVKVEELFRCEHPVLGPAKDGQLEPEAILTRGFDYARREIEAKS